MVLIMLKQQGLFMKQPRLDTTCAMAYWGLAYVLGLITMEGWKKIISNALTMLRAKQNHFQKLHAQEAALINALQSRYETNAAS